MTNSEKIVEFIIKLNESTSNDKKIWKKDKAPTIITKGTDDVVVDFFTTEALESKIKLCIFERRYLKNPNQKYFEAVTSSLAGAIGPEILHQQKTSDWDTKKEFCMIDDFDDVIFKFTSKQSLLADLHATVKTKTINVDSIIDEIISDLG